MSFLLPSHWSYLGSNNHQWSWEIKLAVIVSGQGWRMKFLAYFSVLTKKLVGNAVSALSCSVKWTMFSGFLGGGRACSLLWGRWRTSSLDGCVSSLSGRAVKALCEAKRARKTGRSGVHSGRESKLLLKFIFIQCNRYFTVYRIFHLTRSLQMSSLISMV